MRSPSARTFPPGSHRNSARSLVLICSFVREITAPLGCFHEFLLTLAKNEQRICAFLQSLPPRGAWIEMQDQGQASGRRRSLPHGERGSQLARWVEALRKHGAPLNFLMDEETVPIIFLWQRIRLWSSMGLSCHLHCGPQQRNPGKLRNLLSCNQHFFFYHLQVYWCQDLTGCIVLRAEDLKKTKEGEENDG